MKIRAESIEKRDFAVSMTQILKDGAKLMTPITNIPTNPQAKPSRLVSGAGYSWVFLMANRG